MKGLTEKEKNILDLIIRYIDKYKISPTTRELGEIAGLSSTSTVHGYLKRLEKKGYINKRKDSPRSITINI